MCFIRGERGADGQALGQHGKPAHRIEQVVDRLEQFAHFGIVGFHGRQDIACWLSCASRRASGAAVVVVCWRYHVAGRLALRAGRLPESPTEGHRPPPSSGAGIERGPYPARA